eukprot:TRINITY_DN19739_c0_g1_i1.p1 TRINITY_DN19739_c0_g1~~TRINITY_DN19739_c0_g1_i1.p1  ORF type:complete len:344 (+),score=49.48 TRINITY_DN19739_c0_g1_i1:31-1062(+)
MAPSSESGAESRRELLLHGVISEQEQTLHIISRASTLTDKDAVDGFDKMRADLVARCPLNLGAPSCSPSLVLLRRLDLGNNALGNAAVTAMVRMFREGNVRVVDLRLHKNKIGLPGVKAISSMLEGADDWQMSPPLLSLHLSHNYIPQSGAETLLTALARNRNYPRREGSSCSPLFLRLEHQLVPWQGGDGKENFDRACEFIQSLNQKMVRAREEANLESHGALLCMAPRGRCTTLCCERSCKVEGRIVGTPLAHVPYFWNQTWVTPRRPSAGSHDFSRCSDQPDSAQCENSEGPPPDVTADEMGRSFSCPDPIAPAPQSELSRVSRNKITSSRDMVSTRTEV